MIAIFDPCQHVVGMKKIFPEADYYTYYTYMEYNQSRENFIKSYGFDYSDEVHKINSNNYDILIIIFPTYDNFKVNATENNKHTYNTIISLINNNNFKKILYFDNYDYDYDLENYLPVNKDNLVIYKRHYNINKKYSNNVFSFPFMIFGSPKDILWKMIENHDSFINKLDRRNEVCWTGGLYCHDNDLGYPVYRNRYDYFEMIKDDIDNTPINKENFINTLSTFKFGADILGVGDPNLRTLELLIARTLIIQQENGLKWPFEDGYLVPKELQFNSKDEFKKIVNELKTDITKYDYYISEQNRKFDTYFTIKWLRNYILNCANINDIIIITSVINTGNVSWSYTPKRSLFNSEERFQQTLKSIYSLKKYMPNTKILLVEGGKLEDEKLTIFKSLCDYVYYMGDDEETYKNCILSNCKGLGDSWMTRKGIEFIENNGIRAKNIYKLSGRYCLNENYNCNNISNELPTFKHVIDNVYCTFFFSVPYSYLSIYKNILDTVIDVMKVRTDISLEIILPEQFKNKNIVRTIGAEGLIAVDETFNLYRV